MADLLKCDGCGREGRPPFAGWLLWTYIGEIELWGDTSDKHFCEKCAPGVVFVIETLPGIKDDDR